MVGIAKDSQFIPHICEVNQEEDLSACRKALKHRIMYLLDLPPEMNDPYWDEREFSNLRSSGTRRALFADRFNLSNVQHKQKRG